MIFFLVDTPSLSDPEAAGEATAFRSRLSRPQIRCCQPNADKNTVIKMVIRCHGCGRTEYRLPFNPQDPEQYCFTCWKGVSAEQHGCPGPYHCPRCRELRFDFLYYTVAGRWNMCKTCLDADEN